MNGDYETIAAEAAAWHIASEQDDMDWDAFTLWLEANPHHRAAYDEVAMTDAMVMEHRDAVGPAIVAANDDMGGISVNHDVTEAPRRRIGWRLWSGLAVAASLSALLLVPRFMAEDSVVYQTQSSSRTIALNDGSQVVLAPRSRLEIADGEQHIALNGGAWFDIRHDPARTLTVTAGGAEISDIGTQFDIQDSAGKVRVVVAEGKVRVSANGLTQPISLAAGHGLTLDLNGGTAQVGAVPIGDAGAWRSGRLSYEDTPLMLVAADIARYSGVKVTVSAPLIDRKFSGTLIVGNGETALRDLSQLMGVGLSGVDGAYRIGSDKR